MTAGHEPRAEDEVGTDAARGAEAEHEGPDEPWREERGGEATPATAAEPDDEATRR